MKTEDLQGKGLNQEQIDFVMAEYGKDLKRNFSCILVFEQLSIMLLISYNLL